MAAEFTAAEQALLTKDMSEMQKMMFHSQLESVKKDPGTMLVLSILFGCWGVDRFMLGDVGMGVLKLLTLGCCGILTIVDWFLVRGKTAEFNRKKAQEIALAIKMTS